MIMALILKLVYLNWLTRGTGEYAGVHTRVHGRTSSTRSSTGTAVVLNFKLALLHVVVLNLVSPREGTGYWVLQNTVYPGRSKI